MHLPRRSPCGDGSRVMWPQAKGFSSHQKLRETGEDYPVEPLISDSWPLQLWENKLCCFKPPSLWLFVTEAQGSFYKCVPWDGPQLRFFHRLLSPSMRRSVWEQPQMAWSAANSQKSNPPSGAVAEDPQGRSILGCFQYPLVGKALGKWSEFWKQADLGLKPNFTIDSVPLDKLSILFLFVLQVPHG